MKIACRICGREFEFLPPHLRIAHGTTPETYRLTYDIAAEEPLASERYCARRREIMHGLQEAGVITYERR
jgi:predicted transcriptional regulator